MKKVKALKAHGNRYGKQYEKAAGEEYLHPDPQALVDNKIVEIVADDAKGKGRGAPGTGAGVSEPAQGGGSGNT
jgi:hypothetical protein